ncbi:MAG: hypothetical protein ABIH36_02980 [bacterium]
MSLSELQQAVSLLSRASDVLLTVPPKALTDPIASLIALYLSLTTGPTGQAQDVDPVSPSHLPRSLQFLAGSSQIKTGPTERPEVILDMAIPHQIEYTRQEKLQGGTRLHVSFPTGATITKDQMEITVRPLPYDAAIVIGASDLEELGDLFTKHADFFYNTPIVNIDHRAANEHFGTVNLVDITAGSCAEVTHDLIASLCHDVISSDIATALYAGIVAGTDSFQKPSTTPRSFQVAARLIELAADREAVIQHLIKTKPLSLIKLTGAIYARLRHEEQVGLFWTILEQNDFQTSGATEDDIPAAATELISNIAGFNAAFLLYQKPSIQDQYSVYLILGKGLRGRRREIQQVLSAQKENGALTFNIIAPSIEAAEREAHNKVKQILP